MIKICLSLVMAMLVGAANAQAGDLCQDEKQALENRGLAGRITMQITNLADDTVKEKVVDFSIKGKIAKILECTSTRVKLDLFEYGHAKIVSNGKEYLGSAILGNYNAPYYYAEIPTGSNQVKRGLVVYPYEGSAGFSNTTAAKFFKDHGFTNIEAFKIDYHSFNLVHFELGVMPIKSISSFEFPFLDTQGVYEGKLARIQVTDVEMLGIAN